jgi:D-arabinitol dehydrogenase (NADP+)
MDSLKSVGLSYVSIGGGDDYKMKALSITQPGKSAIIEQAVPTPKGRELLIRVANCGVCGTDVHIFRGEYIGNYPIVPGHEFAGTIEAVGPDVTSHKVGDRVAVEPNLSCGRCEACLNNRQNFCLNWQAVGVTLSGGMAEFVIAPEVAAFNIGTLDFEIAAFVEPLSCVLHGINKLNLEPGSRVAVLGAGPIGMQLIRTLRALGAGQITVADRNRDRLAFAEKDGFYKVVGDVEELRSDHYDIVVEATGVPALVPVALKAARYGGEVLLFGVSPQGKTVIIEPFGLFRKGLTVFGSYTSVRNSFQAIRLLECGRVRVDDLVSHRLPLSEFERGVSLLEAGKDSVMKVMMVPEL